MMRRNMRALVLAACGAIVLLAATSVAQAWETVVLELRSPDGATQEVRGQGLAFGYYVREFSPKGVKDRLKVERSLAFPDRDIRFPDLESIEFSLEEDSTAGVLVPVQMRVTYRSRRGETMRLDRPVSELKGFGNPKPIVFILTTTDGKQQFDLTPPFEEEARAQYRPLRRIRFE